MEKYFSFNFYKFVLFLIMFLFFSPIAFEAFKEESWIKMIVMILFALTGLFEAVRTVLQKKNV
jgi:hypothetical protein